MTKINQETQFTIWKQVPDYVNIEASQYGKLRNSVTHEPLSFYDCGSGYYAVTVTEVNGRRIMQRVHTLVMLAFKGKRPAGRYVDHKNRNKLDNKLSNLRYITPKENGRNRTDQSMVEYNGQQVALIVALEDMFGPDCVTASVGGHGYRIYARLIQRMRKGKTFNDAIEYELKKHGWPSPECHYTPEEIKEAA